MAWRRIGDKPLSEPMMVRLLTHIYASLGLNELNAPRTHALYVFKLELTCCYWVVLFCYFRPHITINPLLPFHSTKKYFFKIRLLPHFPGASLCHDDVIKWKHFPRYWPFVRGIHRSSINSPHKGQRCGVLMFPLICAWINDWVNNHEAANLRRYRAYHDVTIMAPRKYGCSLILKL